jgi:hypothetical protein
MLEYTSWKFTWWQITGGRQLTDKTVIRYQILISQYQSEPQPSAEFQIAITGEQL